MIGNTFVFDGAYHIMDVTFSHLRDDAPERDPARVEQAVLFAGRSMGPFYTKSIEATPAMRGTAEANYDLLFARSPNDMAVVGNLPFNVLDAAEAPGYFLKIDHGFAAAYPERCVFAGGVDPAARGLDFALDFIEYQVRELGASSIKFYPFQWAFDDEKIAYPMFEKCRSLGIDVIGVHLCLPLSAGDKLEMQHPTRLESPAVDFPDLTFIMHHPGPLFFQETLSMMIRIPNMYLLLSPLIHFAITKPRMVQHILGELLAEVGSDRLVWGSEGAAVGNSSQFIENFMEFDIPQELCEGYGYPQITQEDKDNILGLNLARLFDIDVEAKKKELAALPIGR